MGLVHMNNTTYCASQKKPAHKPTASSQPPKTTAHSEAGLAKVPDETEAEPSGVQDNVDVRVHFLRLTAGAHSNYLINERMRCLTNNHCDRSRNLFKNPRFVVDQVHM
jgi:hypothetical protein